MELGSGFDAKVQNAGVTSLNMFQISHTVIFPWPAKDDTMSHPLNACTKGNAMHLSGPKAPAISCAGSYRRLCLNQRQAIVHQC